MDLPVDLTNLRSMTDGDEEIEKDLFAEFIVSFEQGLHALQEHCTEQGSQQWRHHSHALKGIAINLGAVRLGELCKMAQEEFEGIPKARQEMLRYIEAEYEKVKLFLQKQAA